MVRQPRSLSLVSLIVPLLCACGGSSPTAPAAAEPMAGFQVATPQGVASVRLTADCATSTEAEIAGEIGQGYRRATAEAPEAASVPLEPLAIQVLAWRAQGVWFSPPVDLVEYGCGDEGAIEHEMGHRIAHYLGRSCAAEVWHSVDLNCQPL